MIALHTDADCVGCVICNEGEWGLSYTLGINALRYITGKLYVSS